MRYEPNGIMMLTNEVFRMVEKITYGVKALKAKAEEIEAIKTEVAKVGIPEIINAITETLDNAAGKINALKENQDAMWNKIAALEAFAYAEPSIKGRIEAIEMKVFGGIAELADAEETEQVLTTTNESQISSSAQTVDAPSLAEDAPLKEAKKKGKGFMARAFGGPEK